MAIVPPKAPNLLIAPTQYEPRYQDQLNGVQRLYYNTIDNGLGALYGPLGGKHLNIPHVAASDSADQYAGGNNTATKVAWNTLDSGAGFTLNVDNTATPAQTGIYKIDYSLQLVNTDNVAHDVVVWLQVNGTQVANSASKFSVPARKSAGVYSYTVAYSSVVFTIVADDDISLWWATDQAYNTVGPVNGVYIEYVAPQTSPYAHPAIPSAIGSITFVSSV